MKTWQLTLLASAVIALTACGGSSNSSDKRADAAPSTPTNPGDDTTYGRVIDGYLEKALVCVDSNNNNHCDTSENPIQTDILGRYKLAGLENKDLIAQAIAGSTKDADDNGAAIKQGFTLKTSANQNGLITPFTTLLVALEKSGLSKDQAIAELEKNLKISASQINQDYIAEKDASLIKIAQVLVDTIQSISAKALSESDTVSADQSKIELFAWEQLTPSALATLTELMAQNTDALPNALAAQWIAAVPAIKITKEEISGVDPVDPPVDPVDPPVDPVDPPVDPVDPPVEPVPSNQFSKISASGSALAANATEYACVTQNIDAAGQVIPSAERNTWMLLIPADATYADIGFTPTGYTETDLFWSYTWEPDESFPDTFKEPNGLSSQYSAENQVEIYVELLNKIKYCGFSDWTVPSLVQMQALNTKPLQSDVNVKTLDRNIFKNFANVETQIFNRSKLNGGDVDPDNYRYLINPFFWTSTRTEENGIPDTSIGKYKKYLHPTETNTAEEIFLENYGAGPYFALRAVRKNRFTRIATDGAELDLTSTDWQCVKDDDAQGRRFWSNPVADFADVKFEDISSKIEAFNTNNRCEFNDWRLPTKSELLTLKPIHSDTYFHIGTLKEEISYNTYNHDYVWLQPKEGDDDEVVQLRMQSDYDLPHTSMRDNNKVKLILVRDDIFSATNFDTTINNHIKYVNIVGDLKTDFDSINIDTSASTENDIKAAFEALSTLPNLIKDRQEKIADAKTILTTAETQFSGLYIDVKTTERTNNLTTEQAAQIRIQNELVIDGHSLKNQLDALFVQYDTISFSSDTAKAEVINAGITSANTILNLLTSLGDKLGDDAIADQAAIEALITVRKTEAEVLPIVSLKGYFKIAKNGDTAKTFEAYGDAWRCVQKTVVNGGFTTKTTWTILDALDLKNNYSTAKQRLIDINTESLCGINNWELPSESTLETLKTLDITTSGGTNTKTIDSSIFVNHKEAIKTAAYYWTNDNSSSPDVFRYANTDSEEDSSSYRRGSDDNVIDVNSRFYNQETTYIAGDTSCGENRVLYNNNCYQVFNTPLIWADANQSCIDSGSALIPKNKLLNVDYNNLSTALSFETDTSYWIEADPGFGGSYAFTIDDDNGSWQIDNSSKSKSGLRPYLCISILPENTPTTPTNGVVNDDDNTFAWTWAAGYENIADYRYSIDKGVTWKQATANPLNVGNKDYAAGDIQVKVQASADFNISSLPLLSESAFTRTGPICAGGDAAAEISGKCYTRHDSGIKWTEARDYCVANNASLASQSTALSIATDLESELGLSTSSSIFYWLLDNELNNGRAKTLTNYSGWRTYDKDSRYPQRFICVK